MDPGVGIFLLGLAAWTAAAAVLAKQSWQPRLRRALRKQAIELRETQRQHQALRVQIRQSDALTHGQQQRIDRLEGELATLRAIPILQQETASRLKSVLLTLGMVSNRLAWLERRPTCPVCQLPTDQTRIDLAA